MLSQEDIFNLAQLHHWAATGVSDYPPRDPLVGQSLFFKRYKTFIHTIDQDADHFAHVFAVEGEWGRGKSRLGHELIAQINDCSKGWYVRGESQALENFNLFNEAQQDKYLGLYIRYSQVASEYQNSDNWFGYGLYKALLPLATEQFDGSIQSKIAEQTLRRFEPKGFDSAKLAECLELASKHDESELYLNPTLVVGLVQRAYEYLKQFGVEYILVVLDELETVAEAATFGLEEDDAKRLDGQAIRLIGKAIKEEDPRRKLPWLRYVALCSPLLGQQLREIQSTARRFELVQLEHNAFADVSDYVGQLKENRKLRFDYPLGLIEAAYVMSGANFGWFNVIMANLDAVLSQFAEAEKPIPSMGSLFESVLESSGRVAKYVLDSHAIEGIQTSDHNLLETARELLFGQLPLPLKACPPLSQELLNLKNEDGEPVASLYVKVDWDALDCRRALEKAKFTRQKDEWVYPSVEQPLNLFSLLQNLRTLAIREEKHLLIPVLQNEFKHLLSLLYDHPAVEFAADALWQHFIGNEVQLPEEDASHIGPSVAMLLRLDLRYRSQQHNSMIFRDPSHADAHEAAMKTFLQSSNQDQLLRYRVRLTGLFRLLDKNWSYAQAPLPNKEGLAIQVSPRAPGPGQKGGLLFCEALKLHPNNLAWFAWVNQLEELEKLHTLVSQTREENGRTPVIAFTASSHLMDQYSRGGISETLKDDVLLYYINASEVDQIERIGLLPEHGMEFQLNESIFTSRFKNKLYALRDFTYQAMHQWRQRLDTRGLIAWPLRPGGKINQAERDLLFKAWKLFVVDDPTLKSLNDIEKHHGIEADELATLFQRLTVGGKVLAQGYKADEHARLFTDVDNPQRSQAQLPPFLARITNPSQKQEWTLEKAERDWYWGYLWQSNGLTAKVVFDDWMWWGNELHVFSLEDTSVKKAKWMSLPLAALNNLITEALNWFDGKDVDGYRITVDKLERVFGYDRIPGLFAPLGRAPQGTETVEAYEQLKKARERFEQLKRSEEALVNELSLENQLNHLPELFQGRAEVLTRVNRVKPQKAMQIQLGNTNTLSLDDKSQPLFQRIEQARLFAEFVEKAAELIKKAVQTRIHDLESECAKLKHFPLALFTLSLQTITHILEGAFQQSNDSETSKTEGLASSETLLHFMRSLQLDKAAERMKLLAEEVGVNIESGQQQAFHEVIGHILSTFRQTKERFEKIQEQHQDLNNRCEQALKQLDPLPIDYPDPEQPQRLAELQQKIVLLGDAFEDLNEQAQNERERFREQARKGQFNAIREIPERLLKPLQQHFHVYGGELRKIEQSIETYRQEKVQAHNQYTPRILAPLFNQVGTLTPQMTQVDEVSSMSLHEVQIVLDAIKADWEKKAQDVLTEVGLNLLEWHSISEAILNGESPSIHPDIQQKLVEKGILKITITFGNPS